MIQIDKNKPVMVTGASGYIASWIVKKLLEQGLTVHGTVRSLQAEYKIKHLRHLDQENPGNLELFEADLLVPESFDAAIAGCELVFHCASPTFINIPDDPEAELVRPALEGTQNVLGAVNRTDSVKRVVLTSSVAAAYGDMRDFLEKIITEDDWNETSSLDHQPYAYSKTVAEKAAWEITNTQDRWTLVVINPAVALGPSLSKRDDFQSVQIMIHMADGMMGMGTYPLVFGVVDVRDIAEAHIQAGFTPEASGRHILASQTMSLLEIGEILRKNFGDGYPFPKRELPKALLWLIAPLLGSTRRDVSRNYGYPLQLDNSRSIHELGIQYRPVEDTLVEHFQQILNDKLLPEAAV